MPFSDTTLLEQRLMPGGYRVMRLQAPELAATVLPGQYVLLRVPNLEPTLLRRPFSVYRTDGGEVEILYKGINRGTIALTRLEPGAVINLMGPLGNGFPLDGDAHPILIGGGYGVAPLAFLASRLGRTGVALLGGRTSDDVLCGEDFAALGWRVEIATEDGSRGHKGMVTELLDEYLAPGQPRPVLYSCGPDGMLRAVAERAIAADCQAWLSVNRHMACGVGACLVCVLEVHDDGESRQVCACTEGPVFEAHDIIWEKY